MSDWFSDFIAYIDDYTWLVALILIIGFGSMFIYVIRGSSLRLGESIRLITSTKKTEGISSLGTFFMALSTRMGAGNIIGVAIAIIVGGAGSILWMWVFAIFGAALCFSECILGQIFKSKMKDGTFRGGPAYYIKKALKNPKMAFAFALVFLLIGLLMGGVEACNLNQSIVILAPNSMIWLNSLLIALCVFVIVTMGLKKISKFLSVLVPVVGSLWVIIVIITLVMNYQNIPNAFGQIISGGLNLQGFSGAIVGTLIITGFKRGAFCSEGGTGLISSISSSADDDHPCVQGYIQSLGVYVDIFVICTATALLLLTCGGTIPQTSNEAIQYIADALGAGLLGDLGKPFVGFVLIVITFGTTIGSFLIAETSSKYLFDESRRTEIILAISYGLIVFFLSMQKMDIIWNFADFLIAVVIIINVLIMIRLRKYIKVTERDYSKKRKQGVESPKMDVNDFGDMDTNGITEWHA